MFNFSEPALYSMSFEIWFESDYMTEEEADYLLQNWKVADVGETVFEISLNFTDYYLVS
jgi:hypothetical protein